MHESEFSIFSEAWMTAYELSSSSKKPGDGAINKAFDLLQTYSIKAVLKAIELHTQNSKFPPTPADTIKFLEMRNRRIPANEAWSLCPRSEDETVVWTEEAAQAFAAAAPLLAEGDKIGARMAFKDAYDRAADAAMLVKKPIQYQVSVGHDAAQRNEVVSRAIRQGVLTLERGQVYLYDDSQPSGPIAGLLKGATEPSVLTGEMKTNLGKLKDILGFKKKPAVNVVTDDEKERRVERNRLQAEAIFKKAVPKAK